MGWGHRYRHKATEWIRRYLPLEIAGWVAELGSAAVAYAWTGSLVAAAMAATIGSSVGYYTPAYINAVRWSKRPKDTRPWWVSMAVTQGLALRSLAVEFGPAEVIDTAVVRPALIYATPVVLGHVVWGWIVGGFLADVLFYVWTIFSYERLRRFIAVKRPACDESPEAVVGPVRATG